MIIVLDMDGVMCDFVGQACEWFGYTDPYTDKANRGNPNLNDIFGISLGIFDSMFGNSCFWSSMQPMPDWEIMSSAIREPGYKVIVASHTTVKNSQAYNGKMRWVEKHAPWVDDVVLSANSKQLLVGEDHILIDDSDDIVAAWRCAGGPAILIPRPWNSLWSVAEDWAHCNFLRAALKDVSLWERSKF